MEKKEKEINNNRRAKPDTLRKTNKKQNETKQTYQNKTNSTRIKISREQIDSLSCHYASLEGLQDYIRSIFRKQKKIHMFRKLG